MNEPAQKCENNAIFKQNYTLELFISLKMAICCCFGLRGNLEFPDFLQKKFENINYWFCGKFCLQQCHCYAMTINLIQFQSYLHFSSRALTPFV